MDINKNQDKSTDFLNQVKEILAEKGCSHYYWKNDVLYFMQQLNATPYSVANNIIAENGQVTDFTQFYL